MSQRLDPLALSGSADLADATGRTLVEQGLVTGERTLVVVSIGEGFGMNNVTDGSAVVSSPRNHNLSICDGAIYQSRGSLLGTPGAASNALGVLADRLISDGYCSRVILVPIAVAAASVNDWQTDGGKFAHRIGAAVERLAARGLTPSLILWAQGPTDAAQTGVWTDLNYNLALESAMQAFRCRDVWCPVVIARMSWVSGALGPDSAAVRAGQLLSARPKFGQHAGPDLDTLGNAYRSNGTDFNAAGVAVATTLWVASIKAAMSAHAPVGPLRQTGRLERQGAVLVPTVTWEEGAVSEPTVIFDGGIFKMWYVAGWTGGVGIGYATSLDGFVWTKQFLTGPIFGRMVGGFLYAAHPYVVKVGLTYYLYFSSHAYPATIYVATSADGFNFNTPVAAVAPGTNDVSPSNSFVWKEGATWYMIYDSFHTGLTGYGMFLASSSDGVAWTKVAELTSLQFRGTVGGPTVVKVGSTYHMWLIATSDEGGYVLPSDVYYATSTNRVDWTIQNDSYPILARQEDWEYDQLADPEVLEVGGNTFFYHDGLHNGLARSRIGLAIFRGPVSELIAA
jgi:hypothetical protein